MKNEADLLVKYAEREATRSRARLLATIAEIRHRADPRVIVAESAENMVARANMLLNQAEMTVKNRPMISLGSVAAFAIAVGLRIWISKRNIDPDAT